MPVHVNCPGCQAAYTLPDHMAGQQVRCEQCRKLFRVGKPKPAGQPLDVIVEDEDAPEAVQNRPGRVPPPLPPESKSSGPRQRPGNGKPAPPPPPPPRKKGSAAPFIIVGVLVVLLLLCGGGIATVGGLIWYFASDSGPVASHAQPSAPVIFIDTRPPDNRPSTKPKDPPDENPPIVKPPVNPPPAVNADVVKLPGAATDVVVGGGGRYLVFNVPTLRKLAVFDVNAKKISGYVPAQEDGVKFAAGLEKLLVIAPATNLIQRYDLATCEREQSAPCPIDGVKWAVMGSASGGPLMVNARPVGFIDVATLKQADVKVEQGRVSRFGTDNWVRASADGRTFASWGSGSPSGIQTLVLEGNSARGYYEHSGAGHLCPGPDGRVLYTARGLFTGQAKQLGDTQAGPYCIPADQGPFYLTVDLGGRRPPRDRKDAEARVVVHVAGDPRPAIPLPQVDVPREINQWDREPFGNDKRYHLNPDARLLVYIPDTNDQLMLHKLNVEEELNRSGIDYLYVASQPPAQVTRGGQFRYQVVVKSRKGDLKYHVDAGPKEMQVAGNGLIVWNVPGDFSLSEVDVIITVRDGTGQEIFHTFHLPVRDPDRRPGGAPR